MEFLEHPLLNWPSLTLSLLKPAAEREQASLADALSHLEEVLTLAHESPGVDRIEIADRLETMKGHLIAAGLLRQVENGFFAITDRGRRVLSEHPLGVDDTVLAAFPEFRDYMHRRHPPHQPEDAQAGAHEEGYRAFQEGEKASDNPYAFDSCGHLAWENGWHEARDDALEHPYPLPLRRRE
jgi:restriction endonuclease Mrr